MVRLARALLFVTVVGAPAFVTAAEASRSLRFFSAGWRYDKESIGVVSDGRGSRWNVESAVVEATASAPSFFLGQVRVEPAFKIAGGLAEAEVHLDFAGRTETIYSGRGKLLAGSVALTATPCGTCPVSLALDSEYRTLFHAEPYDRPDRHADLEQFREYGTGVRFGYGLAAGRFSPHVGMRWIHTDANADVSHEGPRPRPLDHDRLEPFGGFDFQLPHLLGTVHLGSDWFSVSFGYRSDPGDFQFEQPCGEGLSPCDPGHFCSFPPNAPCGSSAVLGTCRERPLCGGPVAQVCGCDEKTYDNVNCANNAGVSVSRPGPCTDPCNPSPAIVNGGFENGTTGWLLDFPVKGPAPQIVTAATPLMEKQGTAVAPYCGSSMLRINDLGGGVHQSWVWQTFTLPADASQCAGLRIHWGAMLEDGGHSKDAQPYFEIVVRRGPEQLYSYRADATNAGSNGWTDVRASGNSDPVWYRHALATIPISGRAGDTIEVSMTVRDCTESAHGGAAFIDCVELIDRCAGPCAFPGKQPFGDLLVPNVFTPNGDHVNDVFGIGNAAGACSASVKVWDRWGKIAMQNSWFDPNGAPANGLVPLWDGRRSDGSLALPSANPYYFIASVTSCSETKEVPGFVYVFRTAPTERGDLLHVAAPTTAGDLWHTIRYDAEFTWQEFRDVENMADERGEFVDVDTAMVGNQLHVVGATKDGTLWHAIRFGAEDGWSSFASVNVAAQAPDAKFLRVAAADVNGELHVCAIDTNNKLWHTVRHANDWQFFGDVLQITGGTDDGNNKFIDVGCAAVNGELQVLVINENGNLYHTVRHANTWQKFLGNVRTVAGPPFLAEKFRTVSAGELNGELHVCTTSADSFKLHHTIRGKSWQFFGDVMEKTGVPKDGQFVDVSCRASRGELHVVGVTKVGGLWHTIRHAAGWENFRNIEEAQAGERGDFVAVGIVGVRLK